MKPDFFLVFVVGKKIKDLLPPSDRPKIWRGVIWRGVVWWGAPIATARRCNIFSDSTLHSLAIPRPHPRSGRPEAPVAIKGVAVCGNPEFKSAFISWLAVIWRLRPGSLQFIAGDRSCNPSLVGVASCNNVTRLLQVHLDLLVAGAGVQIPSAVPVAPRTR